MTIILMDVFNPSEFWDTFDTGGVTAKLKHLKIVLVALVSVIASLLINPIIKIFNILIFK